METIWKTNVNNSNLDKNKGTKSNYMQMNNILKNRRHILNDSNYIGRIEFGDLDKEYNLEDEKKLRWTIKNGIIQGVKTRLKRKTHEKYKIALGKFYGYAV